MAGPVEESTKAVGSYITALGTQPVLLVQSLIIAGIVFLLYAQGSRGYTERETLLKGVFDSQSHVREILSQCIVPPDKRSGELIWPPGEPAIPLPQPRPLEGTP